MLSLKSSTNSLISLSGQVIDLIAPTLSNPVDSATSSTTADLSVDTNEGRGTIYWVVTESNTAPSKAEVKSGQDHTGSSAVDNGSSTVSSTGTKSFSSTGLTNDTTYYAHFMQEDPSGNQSDVVSGDGFTTPVAIGGKEPLVWIDATSTNYLYQDNGTSTPVTSVNDPVGRITDRSKNNRYGFQGSASLKGLWTGTGIALDGTDDRYEFVLALGDRTDDMAVFLVSVVDSTTGRFAGFLGAEDGNSNPNTGRSWGVAVDGNLSTGIGGPATAQRVNGSAVTTRDETFDAMATDAVTLWEVEGAQVASGLKAADGGPATRPGIFNFGGDIGFIATAELRAFLVFDMTSWGAGDIDTVRSAIATEYGVTL